MSALSGRVALITGATSGIGRGICERLAAEGAAVCVVSRHADRSEAVAATIAQAALAPMLAQGRGDIVAIASAGGTKGYPDWSGYCATKWAIVGFMECLAQEVVANGIRVSTICPGGVDTPFWDALNEDINRSGSEGRASLMQPADIAETVMLQLRLPRNVLVKRTLLFPTSEWH